MCKRCPRREAKPSPWVGRLLYLRTLRMGGYPFAADDLDLETWADLGELEMYFEARRPRLF